MRKSSVGQNTGRNLLTSKYSLPGRLSPSPTPIDDVDEDDDSGEEEDVDDTGVVSAVSSTAITVNGVTYTVTSQTEIRGDGVRAMTDIQ